MRSLNACIEKIFCIFLGTIRTLALTKFPVVTTEMCDLARNYIIGSN